MSQISSANTFIRLIIVGAPVLLIIGLFGCSPKSAGQKPGREFETAWIDPEIILSDSLVTLIRAQRIDSIPLRPDQELRTIPVTSFEFHLDDKSCWVTATVQTESGEVVKDLFLRLLAPGYYKMTVQQTRLFFAGPLVGPLVIRLQFCDSMMTLQLAGS